MGLECSHSASPDTPSEYVLESWPEFSPPGACQGVRRLEVFAYKLIWRSARLNLSTGGQRMMPSGWHFETKQLSSLTVMKHREDEQQGKVKCKMSNNSPSKTPSQTQFLFHSLPSHM